jgi:diadenosine tetraphosphate (Ap4A) HIT family hydrolase
MLGEELYERRTRQITPNFVAMPSIGALSACHVLLCPQPHVRSFAELGAKLRLEGEQAAGTLERVLLDIWEMPMHLFEHGNETGGQRAGCSVEHAHLHFLGSSADVWEHASAALPWVEAGAANDIYELAAGSEYLRYRRPDGQWLVSVTTDRPIPSQLMRQVFAAAHDEPASWDWRTEPALARVAEMWRRLAA